MRSVPIAASPGSRLCCGMGALRRAAIACVLLSIALRIGLGYYARESFYERGNRYTTINAIARTLLGHWEFGLSQGDPTIHSEPVYPALVALAYALLGEGWLAVVLLQSAACVFAAWLLYLLALRLLADERAALLGAAAVSMYPYYITQSISVSDTVVFTALLALSVYLTVRLQDRDGDFRIGILAGGAWGLALMTRASAVAFIPFMLGHQFLALRARRAAFAAGGMVLGCVLALSPWLLRNYMVTGGEVVLTSHGTIGLWFAYNDDTERVLSGDISVDEMRSEVLRKVPEVGEIRARAGRSVEKELAESRAFFSRAVAYALEDPVRAVRMMPLKLWKFWSWNWNPRYDGGMSLMRYWPLAYTASYLPVLLLGAFGAFAAPGGFRRHGAVLWVFAGYSLLHAVVYGFSRLRVPIDQFLILYAAYAVSAFIAGRTRGEQGG